MTDQPMTLPCSSARFQRQPHAPHSWEPQPGMTPVHCDGYGEQPTTQATDSERCCVCGGGPVTYRNHLKLLFCAACADCPCGQTPCVRTGVNDPAVAGPAATEATGLREWFADAIRDAACTTDCGQTEEECTRERIQPTVWHHGSLVEVEGTPEMFADAVLALVRKREQQLVDAHRVTIGDLRRAEGRVRILEAALARVEALAARIAAGHPVQDNATNLAAAIRDAARTDQPKETP
ncbi:hypothetical protein [Streptomyces prasinus]|uniref:hypothetical protein n=1 Tax=Streptomyces prasinus TaxID=67345 RepID=UPI0033BD4D7D